MSPENTYNYDMSFNPPAPVIEIELSSPDEKNTSEPIKIPGQLDTGAEGTLIPNKLIDELGLLQVDEILVGGYDDDEENYEERPIYSVTMTIGPLENKIVEVIPLFSSNSDDYALIGRDIINRMLITLDGPRSKMYLNKK